VGDTTVTFDVEAIIPGLYGDTVSGVTLDPAACSTLTFMNWVVPDSNGICFPVNFRTLLSIDANPANDTLSTRTCADCPVTDLSILEILEPPDTVACDDTVGITAVVCNNGDTTVSADVVAVVDSSGLAIYSDSMTSVILAPGACDTLTFTPWVVPFFHGFCYDIIISTLVPDDDPSNDTLSKQVCANCPAIRDVGVISIDDPPDTVYADSTYPVMVTVVNFGDTTETFPVTVVVSSYVDTNTVSSLAPGDTAQVTFTNWTVPPDTCDWTYTMMTTTLLGTDMNAVNDTMSKGVFVICDTTGISEELHPNIPAHFALHQSRPNPFSSTTEIRYALPVESHVSLIIFDTSGRVIRRLVNGVEQEGFKRTSWDGRDDLGVQVGSGIYFYKLNTSESSQTRKMILFR
jgi:hypothetical protein